MYEVRRTGLDSWAWRNWAENLAGRRESLSTTGTSVNHAASASGHTDQPIAFRII